ncbi:MAG TPA: deoxyribodipyrimidine photo-lyase [Candidatus Eremiobacteraceae bacterium]|nr:deoxyribodipyrimidine photo-lyase [Candidatus Eremiobacteraceae bacterium]
MTVSIHWFRRDLRLRDNPSLTAASNSSQRIYGAYSLEDFDPLNERQRAFAAGCVKQLRATLDKRDASLTVLDGSAATALVSMAKRLDAAVVHVSRAYSGRELALQQTVSAALASAGIELQVHRGHAVHEPETIAERKAGGSAGYRVFPPFYDVWKSIGVDFTAPESASNSRDPSPGPLPEPPASLFMPPPGEEAATNQLTRFITARLADYAVNGEYPARNATSGLGAYLRFGCLSTRTVYRAVAERMSRSWTLAQERMSMEAYFRRLALADFFTHLASFDRTLHDEALQEKMRSFGWSTDGAKLEAWLCGRTGYPFVDAAMRQLGKEGHVHQRAGIAAASFCCFDLGLDWRLGRDAWMRASIEADEALCDGNWQWIAGVGSDQAAYPRIYNPEKQARHFDAQAMYVRRYCPELTRLPTRAALAPWQLERTQQVELGFFSPDDYPKPIVDHDEAARDFLARYEAHQAKAGGS